MNDNVKQWAGASLFLTGTFAAAVGTSTYSYTTGSENKDFCPGTETIANILKLKKHETPLSAKETAEQYLNDKIASRNKLMGDLKADGKNAYVAKLQLIKEKLELINTQENLKTLEGLNSKVFADRFNAAINAHIEKAIIEAGLSGTIVDKELLGYSTVQLAEQAEWQSKVTSSQTMYVTPVIVPGR